MRTTSPTGKKVRLNLELTEALKERLTKLQERTEASSVTEVLRTGLAVYDMIAGHVASGGKLVLRDKDGNDEVVILPFQKISRT